MLDIQGGDRSFRTVSLPPNAGLLLSEQLIADLVGVVGLQKLPFLGCQTGKLLGGLT